MQNWKVIASLLPKLLCIIAYYAKLGQGPLVTLKIGQGQPKVNQVRSMDHRKFLPNYIEIRLLHVVFF